jgi:hypothetical protein
MKHALSAVDFINDGEGKPVGIQKQIGRRPIAAFRNSDGDLQMLQWTAAGPGARFCLYVHHDDAEREYAYGRQSHIGRPDKGHDEAAANGWTVVSMKNDWKTVYSATDQTKWQNHAWNMRVPLATRPTNFEAIPTTKIEYKP